MSESFRVIFKGSLGFFERRYSFPTFQKLLAKGEVMTIIEVGVNERLQQIYLRDQNDEIHYGIEITEN